jgi:hypothetical protein
MLQFVSHSLDQLWNAEGLVKGPPRSEQFRAIQNICFSADA